MPIYNEYYRKDIVGYDFEYDNICKLLSDKYKVGIISDNESIKQADILVNNIELNDTNYTFFAQITFQKGNRGSFKNKMFLFPYSEIKNVDIFSLREHCNISNRICQLSNTEKFQNEPLYTNNTAFAVKYAELLSWYILNCSHKIILINCPDNKTSLEYIKMLYKNIPCFDNTDFSFLSNCENVEYKVQKYSEIRIFATSKKEVNIIDDDIAYLDFSNNIIKLPRNYKNYKNLLQQYEFNFFKNILLLGLANDLIEFYNTQSAKTNSVKNEITFLLNYAKKRNCDYLLPSKDEESYIIKKYMHKE